jgi:hypothetical protein
MHHRKRSLLAAVAPLTLLLSGLGTVAVPSLTTPAAASAPVTPVVSGNTNAIGEDSPDPDIVRVGSTFYAFTTGTTWGNQIGIQTSTHADPRGGWTAVGSAFPGVPFFDKLAPWEDAQTTTSPGVFHFDNEWIMYYDANNDFTHQGCLSVATASNVTGPYMDNSTGPLVCQTTIGGDLDPQPFVDPQTGTAYLIWKSNDGSSAAPSQVWSQPIAPNGISLLGSPTVIFTVSSGPHPWQATTDDPSMAFAGGNYYLFFSGGDFVANSPPVFYPTGYVVCSGPSGGCDANEAIDPILGASGTSSAPGGAGGGMVFTDATGNWWLSSQTWEPTNCINYNNPSGSCAREMFIAQISLPQIPPPSITTSSLPAAGAGTPYVATLAATSGTAPYTYSIASGSPALPGTLSLNAATGAISGTAPGTTGTTMVTFEVTDAQGETATKQLAVVVKAGSVTTPMANPTSIISGTSVTYSATVAPSSTGSTPTGSVSFSVGTTPLCTATLASGAGSCSTATTPVGDDTVTATYGGDATYGLSFGTTSVLVISGPYTPLPPVRVCDTRPVSSFSPTNQCNNGVVSPSGPVTAGGTKVVNLANAMAADGVPSGATSVVLNVTVVNAAAPGGFMTVFPTGAPQPNASNLNYVAGEVIPNLVEVGVGTNGQVSFASSSQTDLLVDLEGYTSAAGAGLYTALSPTRICDTRVEGPGIPSNQCNNGVAQAAGHVTATQPLTINVANGGASFGVPAGATAAVLNVTDTNPTGAGFVTIYPQGTSPPNASNLNFSAGQTTANRVVVPLSTSGTSSGDVTLATSIPTDLVVDVSGYYSATGAQFSAETAPVRICDTRPVTSFSPLNQCSNKPLGAGTPSELPITVRGLAGVPSSATAVVLNVTGTGPSLPTFLTVFPGGTLPNASDLNLSAGETRPNLDVATVNPTNGKVTIFNQTGSLNVIVDVLGWYS